MTIVSRAIFAEMRLEIRRGSQRKTGSFAQDWKSSSVENAGRSERIHLATTQIARLMYVTMRGRQTQVGKISYESAL
jgi:hypothetical protein